MCIRDREMIETNPAVLVDVPKIHEKSIIRLDADEVALLLDHIEHAGDTLTGQKRAYWEKMCIRDRISDGLPRRSHVLPEEILCSESHF